MLTTDSSNLFEQHDRVRQHTPAKVNARIDAKTRRELARTAGMDDARVVEARLDELSREWDVDRAVMATFAIVGGLGLALGHLRSRRWHLVLGAQLAFLLNHAVRGWCPPVAVFRRLGYRTQQEICGERRVLEAARERQQGR